jgi:hypothetical protein
VRHHSLPQTLTPEALADWIQENKVDEIIHIDKVPLDDEVRHDLTEKLYAATSAKLKLEELEKQFKKAIKEGTPSRGVSEDTGEPLHTPMDFTVPPTKGTKVLIKNIEHYSQILDKGYKEEPTSIYLIPNPEEKMMVAVDIEGQEWGEYSRAMTDEQVQKYGTIFAKEEEKGGVEEQEEEAIEAKTSSDADLPFGDQQDLDL